MSCGILMQSAYEFLEWVFYKEESIFQGNDCTINQTNVSRT